MLTIDDLRKRYPGKRDDEIVHAYGRVTGQPADSAAIDLGLDPMSFVQDDPGFVSAAQNSLYGLAGAAGQLTQDVTGGAVGQGLEEFGDRGQYRNPVTLMEGESDSMFKNVLTNFAERPVNSTMQALGVAAGLMGPHAGAKVGLGGYRALRGIDAVQKAGAGARAAGAAGNAAYYGLPSYGSIRDNQEAIGENDAGDMLVAGAGALTIGAMEGRFGPEAWLSKGLGAGIGGPGKNFVRTGLKTGAIEGMEEMAQTPIERAASYEDVLSMETLDQMAAGGVVGFAAGAPMGMAAHPFMKKEPLNTTDTRDLLNPGNTGGAPAQGDLFSGQFGTPASYAQPVEEEGAMGPAAPYYTERDRSGQLSFLDDQYARGDSPTMFDQTAAEDPYYGLDAEANWFENQQGGVSGYRGALEGAPGTFENITPQRDFAIPGARQYGAVEQTPEEFMQEQGIPAPAPIVPPASAAQPAGEFKSKKQNELWNKALATTQDEDMLSSINQAVAERKFNRAEKLIAEAAATPTSLPGLATAGASPAAATPQGLFTPQPLIEVGGRPDQFDNEPEFVDWAMGKLGVPANVSEAFKRHFTIGEFSGAEPASFDALVPLFGNNPKTGKPYTHQTVKTRISALKTQVDGLAENHLTAPPAEIAEEADVAPGPVVTDAEARAMEGGMGQQTVNEDEAGTGEEVFNDFNQGDFNASSGKTKTAAAAAAWDKMAAGKENPVKFSALPEEIATQFSDLLSQINTERNVAGEGQATDVPEKTRKARIDEAFNNMHDAAKEMAAVAAAEVDGKKKRKTKALEERDTTGEDVAKMDVAAEGLLRGDREAVPGAMQLLAGPNSVRLMQHLRSRFGMPQSVTTPKAALEYFMGENAMREAEADRVYYENAEKMGALWDSMPGRVQWASVPEIDRKTFVDAALPYADVGGTVLEYIKKDVEGGIQNELAEGTTGPGVNAGGREGVAGGNQPAAAEVGGVGGEGAPTGGKPAGVRVKKRRTIVRDDAEGVDGKKFSKLAQTSNTVSYVDLTPAETRFIKSGAFHEYLRDFLAEIGTPWWRRPDVSLFDGQLVVPSQDVDVMRGFSDWLADATENRGTIPPQMRDGTFHLELMRAKTDVAEEIRTRNSKGGETTGTTVEAIQNTLEAALGPTVLKQVTVFQAAADAVAARLLNETEALGTQAWVSNDPQRKGRLRAYFIADAMKPGTELAVVLHELGVHMGMRNLLGESNLNRLAFQVKKWAIKNDGSVESEIAKKALARVKAAQKGGTEMTAGDVIEERVAYFVEEAVKAGFNPTLAKPDSQIGRWLSNVWNAFKAALRMMGATRFDKLTAQDVVNLAMAAAAIDTAAEMDFDLMNDGPATNEIERLARLYGKSNWLRDYIKNADNFLADEALGYEHQYMADTPMIARLKKESDEKLELLRRKYSGPVDIFSDTFRLSHDKAKIGPFAGYETISLVERGTDKIVTLVYPYEFLDAIRERAREFRMTFTELLDETQAPVVLTVDSDSDLVIGSATRDSFTAAWLRERDLIEDAFDKDGDPVLDANGVPWQRMKGVTTAQILPLLATTHASIRHFLPTLDTVGIKWERLTGATGSGAYEKGAVGRSGAAYFSKQLEQPGAITPADGKRAADEAIWHNKGVERERAAALGGMERRLKAAEKSVAMAQEEVKKWSGKAVAARMEQAEIPGSPAYVSSLATNFLKGAKTYLENREAELRDVQSRIDEINAKYDAKRKPVGGKKFSKDYTTTAREAAVAAADAIDFGNRWDAVTPKMMTLHQLKDWFGDKLTRLEEYVRNFDKMSMVQQQIMQDGHKVTQEWVKLDKGVMKQLHRAMLDATLSGVHPDLEFTDDLNAHLGKSPEARAKYDAVKAKYDALPQDAKNVYQAAKERLAENWEQRKTLFEGVVTAAYQKRIDEHRANGDVQEVERLEKRRDREIKDHNDKIKSIKGPYFPLMRFGDYIVAASSAEFAAQEQLAEESTGDARREAEKKLEQMRTDAKHYRVEAFQSNATAQKRAAELAKQGYSSARTFKADQFNAQFRPFAASGLEHINSMVDGSFGANAQDRAAAAKMKDLMVEVYISSMPEHAALQRQLKREGIEGASDDMLRAFGEVMEKDAFFLSRMQYSAELADNLFYLKGEAKKAGVKYQHVYDNLQQRVGIDFSYTRTPVQNFLSKASGVFHLGIAPAFLLTNMTQPWMITLPQLAGKYGAGRTFGAIRNAWADSGRLIKAGKGGVLNLNDIDFEALPEGAEREMLKEIADLGQLDITQTADMGLLAEGMPPKLYKGMKVFNWATHHIELHNRVTTALAAFRMEMARTNGDTEASRKAAYDAVVRTQLDYSGTNAAYFMKQGVGPLGGMNKLVYQFRKYQQGMIYLMVRDAKLAFAGDKGSAKSLAYLMGMQIAFAGAAGVPLFAPMLALASLGFGDDDEDPEIWLRNLAADAVGPDTARAFFRGLPTMLGLDVSNNLGMGSLFNPLPMLRTSSVTDAKTGKEAMAEIAVNIPGAWLGMGTSMADAVIAGDLSKAMPRFIRNPMRAATYADEGLMTRNKAEVIAPEDFDGWDLAYRALGFSTTKESEYYAAKQGKENVSRAIKGRRDELLRDYATSRIRGESTADIEDAIREFNMDHPTKGNRIDRSTLLRAVKTRRDNAANKDEAGVVFRRNEEELRDLTRFAR